uniref:Uncharacterized protein n=1 Tax=Leptobrachium leishanense TaxID=445787 RepID=A0A8C5MQA5_9ANUR
IGLTYQRLLLTWKDAGRIKGDILIDLSTGPCIFHLLPIFKCFKDITILEFNESCLKDLQKWLNKETDTYDWAHASKIVAELKESSESWEGDEDDLRRRIKRILKYDFTKGNPTDPVILQKADCVIVLGVLAHISKDLDVYCNNLKKLSSLLKLGGRLLIIGGFHASYYTVAKQKYHILNFSEQDLRAALCSSGFAVERLESKDSRIRDDTVYYHHIFMVSAVKNIEI